ncbi:MAG: hypothetical protein ACRD2T_04075 [Thermoanaerobaculia bacterium]
MPRGRGRNIGAESGNPVGFIARAIQEGMRVTTGRDTFRQAGGRIANQTWSNLWGEVDASLRARGRVAGMDPRLPPADADFTSTSWGRAGTNIYQVDVWVRDPATELFSQRSYSAVFDFAPSLDVATAQAIGDFTEFEDLYFEQVVGAQVTALYRAGVGS